MKFNSKSLASIENYFFPLFDKGGIIKIPIRWERESKLAAKSYMNKNHHKNIYSYKFTIKYY